MSAWSRERAWKSGPGKAGQEKRDRGGCGRRTPALAVEERSEQIGTSEMVAGRRWRPLQDAISLVNYLF